MEIQVKALLILVFTLSFSHAFAQSEEALSIDPNFPLGSVKIINETFEKSITYSSISDDLNLSCGFIVDFSIGSQEMESGEETDWYFQDHSKEFTVNNIKAYNPKLTIKEIYVELAKAQEYLDGRPGINNKAFVKSIMVRKDSINCTLNRTTIGEVCEDYFKTAGLVRAEDVKFLDVVTKRTPLLQKHFFDGSCKSFEAAANTLSALNLSSPLEADALKSSDLTLLKYFKGLAILDLSSNHISDLAPVVGLKKLRHLKINDSGLKDVEKLTALHTLETLSLNGNKLQTTNFLANLKNLVDLDLSNNGIKTLAKLNSLVLTKLNAGFNQITDISFMTAIPSATEINLSNNKIESIAPLKNHGVSLVNFENNLIKDFRVGLTLGSLKRIILINNPTTKQLCPIDLTPREFDDLDQEEKDRLTSSNTINPKPAPYNPLPAPQQYIYVYAEDLVGPLQIACDSHLRATDATYNKYWVKVSRPKRFKL